MSQLELVSRPKIMAVDDEKQILTALEDLLSDDYDVFTSEKAEDALKLIEENDFSVVISDQRMPAMQGDEFLTKLRKVSTAARVLLTGYADIQAVARAINDAQVYHYIHKPWNPDEFLLVISKAVAHHDLLNNYEQERDFLHGLMDSMPDAVFFADRERTFIRVNKAKAKLLNIESPEHAVGRRLEDFDTIEDKDDEMQVDTALLSAQIPYSSKVSCVKLAQDKLTWLSTTKVPIRDKNNQIKYLVGVSRDVTEIKETSLQLQQAQKMEAVGQLTGGIAHDFNNLLTVIMGNARLLERPMANCGAVAKKKLDAIVDAAQRGANLTQRLLAFSRNDKIEPKVVDAKLLISGMVEMIRHVLGATIEIQIRLADEPMNVHTNPNLLESAILNLATNARDAMPEGGTLTLALESAQAEEVNCHLEPQSVLGDYIVFSVSDTGSGIPAEHLDKIFEPFFTTKDVGKGTGLGLSMVFGFVKQSNGLLRVESEMGRGTTFRLFLPNAQEPEALQNDAANGEELTRIGHETILVVEDEPDVRAIAVAMLEDLGYRVIESENGPDALVKLDLHRDIDLLFTDFAMPGGMSGRDLAVRARERTPELKVLFTTGYAGGAKAINGGLPEGASVLSKPYEPGDLAEKVRQTLDSLR